VCVLSKLPLCYRISTDRPTRMSTRVPPAIPSTPYAASASPPTCSKIEGRLKRRCPNAASYNVKPGDYWKVRCGRHVVVTERCVLIYHIMQLCDKHRDVSRLAKRKKRGRDEDCGAIRGEDEGGREPAGDSGYRNVDQQMLAGGSIPHTAPINGLGSGQPTAPPLQIIPRARRTQSLRGLPRDQPIVSLDGVNWDQLRGEDVVNRWYSIDIISVSTHFAKRYNRYCLSSYFTSV
jgi:hypothetical protein